MQLRDPRVTKLISRLVSQLSATRDAIARSARLQVVVLTCGVTVIATTLVADHHRVESTLDALGERVHIYVVTTNLEPGDEITSTNTETVAVPRRFRAATAIENIVQRVATNRLLTGDVLTTSNTTDGASPVIPNGWRGLTINTGPLTESLVAGMMVDVMAGGTILVEGALVIDVMSDARSALIAVPQDRAVTVADAASVGLAVLAIAS